ncbi:hypothetical protein ZWY2020_002619 [Hordeum vulgare]|nr:hypothetical protein ZWY2020_002619 [Hordeum vulgare]
MDSTTGIRDSALDLLAVLLTGRAPAVADQEGDQNEARDVRGALPRGGWRGRAPPTTLLVALLAVVVQSCSFPFISSLSHSGGCVCPGATRKYTGMVEDFYYDYETAAAINEEVLNPILQDLVALPLYMYFKVK